MGCAAEVVRLFLEFMDILFVGWGLARRDEEGMGGLRDAYNVGAGSGGQWLISGTSARLSTCVWAGNSSVLWLEARTVGTIVFELSLAEKRGSSSAVRRLFRLR